MNAINNYFYDWFTSEFLKEEFDRLVHLFVPLWASYLPDVEIRVVDKGDPGEAANSIFDESAIEMYADYHSLYSEEYKVTLLHEAGHFVFSKDHSKFEDFYEYLKFRQQFIEEKVIPDSYEEFLYCKTRRKEGYVFVCSGCRSKSFVHSFNDAYCRACERSMLLVSGL